MAVRMFSFRELGLELKTAVVFGTASLALSLIIGMMSGNNFGNALLTSVILMMVFSGLGYGIIIVLRNFVPEFLELFNTGSNVDRTGDTISLTDDQPSEFTGAVEGEGDSDSGESEVFGRKAGDSIDFEPIEMKGMKQYRTGSETPEPRLGKHIVVDQKKVKYEPKIVAEAIRTMMRRDND